MRLLVTRPEPDAGETAGRLGGLGHAVVIQPMTRIVFSPEPVDWPEPAALVLTSRNAVRGLERWPRAKAWRNLPVFAVGASTAELARRVGFTDVE
ncbi:MAG: uroporphyrinogen-III synthase, partial [Bauldia sp.]